MKQVAMLVVLVAWTVLAGPLFAADSTPTAWSAEKRVWNLDAIYPDEAAWEVDRKSVVDGIARLRSLSGRVSFGAPGLAEVLAVLRRTRGTAGKMARFSLLGTEVDTEDQLARSRYDAATALESQVEAAAAPLEAEIRALGEPRIRAWQVSEPGLTPYRARLFRILAEAPHTPPAVAQGLLAAVMDRWPRSLADAADALTNAELGWTTCRDADGREVGVDPSTYGRLRRSPDRAVRDCANAAWFRRYGALETTYGLLWSRRVEADLLVARQRGFTNHLDAFYWLRDGVPEGSYHRAIETSRHSQALMTRLARVLGRLYETPRVTYSDFVARPYPYRPRIPLDRSLEIIVSAWAPAGPEFQRVLRERMNRPWWHLPPQPHKTETVGVFWQVGGGHPLILMTYRDDLASSRTLANTSGALMTYADIPTEAWPDRREEDPPIHGNAIWYLGGFLHDWYLLGHTALREDRIGLLVEHLQLQVRIAFQFGALIELEDQIRQGIDDGRPLTGVQISAAYLEILRRNLGHDSGGLVVEDAFARQWMTDVSAIFFGPYPSVFLSAGAAAAELAEKLAAGDPRAVAGMRNAMGRNENDCSYELLRRASVDIATTEPYEALLRRIDETVTKLDREVAAMGR